MDGLPNGLPKGLSGNRIADLYSNRRQKGIYDEKLGILIASDEPAINPYETWPMDFPEYVPAQGVKGTPEYRDSKGKSPTTVYQGFRKAADKLGESIASDIDVIQRDGEVYVAVKSRVMPILAAMQDGAESTDEDDEEVELDSNVVPADEVEQELAPVS